MTVGGRASVTGVVTFASSRGGCEAAVEDAGAPCGRRGGAGVGPEREGPGALEEKTCCGWGEDDLRGFRDGVHGDLALCGHGGGDLDQRRLRGVYGRGPDHELPCKACDVDADELEGLRPLRACGGREVHL